MAAVNHYIEESVAIYLQRDPDGTDAWVLDPATLGGPLESNYEEPEIGNCECNRHFACKAVADRMVEVSLPDAEDVMRMLADALGFTVEAKV